MRWRSGPAIPGPSSRRDMRTYVPGFSASGLAGPSVMFSAPTSSTPLLPMASSAFLTILCMTWRICPSSTLRRGRSSANEKETSTSDPFRQDLTESSISSAAAIVRRNGSPPRAKASSLIGKLLSPHAGLLGLGEPVGYLAVLLFEEHLSEGDIAEDDRKKVVEVVGDPAREDAQGFELARLQQLFLHPLFLGNVAENDDGAQGASSLVQDRRSRLRDGPRRAVPREKEFLAQAGFRRLLRGGGHVAGVPMVAGLFGHDVEDL